MTRRTLLSESSPSAMKVYSSKSWRIFSRRQEVHHSIPLPCPPSHRTGRKDSRLAERWILQVLPWTSLRSNLAILQRGAQNALLEYLPNQDELQQNRTPVDLPKIALQENDMKRRVWQASDNIDHYQLCRFRHHQPSQRFAPSFGDNWNPTRPSKEYR